MESKLGGIVVQVYLEHLLLTIKNPATKQRSVIYNNYRNYDAWMKDVSNCIEDAGKGTLNSFGLKAISSLETAYNHKCGVANNYIPLSGPFTTFCTTLRNYYVKSMIYKRKNLAQDENVSRL